MFIRTMFIRSKTLSLSVVSFVILLIVFAFSSSSLGFKQADATSVSNTFTVHLNEVLNINAPGSIEITNCNPSTSNLCTASTSVTVTTNNLTGYSLYMNITSGSSTNLTNTLTTPSSTIPTLSQSYSSSNFPTNYWGYTGGTDQSGETGGYNCATNYCPVLAYESDESNYSPNHLINETAAPSSSSTTNLTFGAKADTSKASGTYTTSVTFTAVTNEVPTPTMQDFNSAACAAATTDQTFTLRDSRDDKEYTIAKLQDGNCWMTQNLALGGSTAMNLTQADSNVGPSGFTLPASVADGDEIGSYTDPGMFDYAGNYDDSTTKYGNYYNWPAATAGSGTNTRNEDAPYDICPKNWRLPSASTSVTDSEFYAMLNNYIISGTWEDSDPDSEWPYWYNVTLTDYTNAPLSFLFSGLYYSYVDYQGTNGFWWSSTAISSDYAYSMTVDDNNNVKPRDLSGKDFGLSVRCLASGA